MIEYLLKKIFDAIPGATDLSPVETALQKIDNQEDSITYTNHTMTSSGANIINAPGAGKALRIHHIYCVNADNYDIEFKIRNGSGGTPYFPYFLASYGGAVAQNLKRPWELSENTALYYDYNTGTTPDGFIVIGYETVDV